MRGEAAFGKDTLLKQTFYTASQGSWQEGLCWSVSSLAFFGGPGPDVHELFSVLPEIAEGTSRGDLGCACVGDRNYHYLPKTKEELVRMGVKLLDPYSSKRRDPGAPARRMPS